MRKIILTLVLLVASAAVGLAQYATVIEEGPDHTYPTFAIAVANDNSIPDNQSIYVVDDGKYQRVKMILRHQPCIFAMHPGANAAYRLQRHGECPDS